MISFTGPDLREGGEFEFVVPPDRRAHSTFVAPTSETEVLVTRRATDLFHLPDDTPVVAHWHGEYRTDAFRLTVGELKAKATVQFG
jgi:hypothetical protein